MNKWLSIKVLILGIISFSIIKAEDNNELNDSINSISNILYLEAEFRGGGSNGENYNKIIKESLIRFKSLLKKYPDKINYRSNNNEFTPLMSACAYNLHEYISLLLEAGADPSISHPEFGTPLDIICLRRCAEFGSITYIVNLIMQNHYTVDRHNKCVDLLTKDTSKRIRYKIFNLGLLHFSLFQFTNRLKENNKVSKIVYYDSSDSEFQRVEYYYSNYFKHTIALVECYLMSFIGFNSSLILRNNINFKLMLKSGVYNMGLLFIFSSLQYYITRKNRTVKYRNRSTGEEYDVLPNQNVS